MAKVSVVVPAYNSESYIKKCLDSILNQTFKDVEIIVVNNGSTDKTEDIVKSYKNKVKLFNLKNPSISEARNKGLKEATSKYVLFFDSDDYMCSDMVEKMYDFAELEDIDIVFCDYYKDFGNNNIEVVRTYAFNVLSPRESENFLYEIEYGPIKLFKTSLLKDNNIYFPTAKKYEDTVLVCNSILESKKVGKVNKPLFYYVIHENSETTVMDERVKDIVDNLVVINNYYKRRKCVNSSLESLNVKLLTRYNIQQRYQKDKKLRNEFIDLSFNFLENNFKDWKKCSYLKKVSFLRQIIYKSKKITKLYCNIYVKFSK